MNKKWFAILPAIVLLSCKKEISEPKPSVINSLPSVINLPVTVTINESVKGYYIPETFEGLSYETGILAENPEILNENNKVLVQLIKNLGSGILRIGGNSSDLIGWSSKARTENTSKDTLTAADVVRLAAFSKAIGWPVIFGLNLGNNNPVMAVSEARFVNKSLGNNLYALQSGNEPDMFHLGPRKKAYNYTNYQAEWDNYFLAVRKAAPHAAFAGPDVTPFNSEWIKSFVYHENKNIKLIDGHYYVTGPASRESITYQSILTPNPKLEDYLGTLHNTSSKYNLPFRLSECNSVFGGGKRGVSDVFAAALWALDFMWKVAEYNGQGVNFHGGGSFFVYSPVGNENGTFVARPEYYAMLAFKYGAAGQNINPVTINQTGYNISVHACTKADSSRSITLINKEAESSFAFTIQLSKTASAVKVARLSAPGIASAIGTTFAGSMVDDNGVFTPDITEEFTLNKKSFVVVVPAGSAAVVTVK